MVQDIGADHLTTRYSGLPAAEQRERSWWSAWLFDFAERNLSTEDARLKAGTEFISFVRRHAVVATRPGIMGTRGLGADFEVRDVQRRVREMLDELRRGGRVGIGAFAMQVSARYQRGQLLSFVDIEGSDSVVVEALLGWLSRVHDALRICPQCGRWFVGATTRKRYCSLKCTNLAATHRFRKRRRAAREEDASGSPTRRAAAPD